MENGKYTIGELAELTGVSRRTVRFYVQRGLIPPPEGAGRGSYYTGGHLQSIARIRALQGMRVKPGSISPAPRPAGPPSRTLATRITLADGVVLELSLGVPVPDDGVLVEVARLLSGAPDRGSDCQEEREPD